jgi:outer membrane lipoprotein-sorting protein
MRKSKRIISMLAIIALITALVGLWGCQEGPLERAGKKVDKAVDDIKR